jgi:hypothetical protein
VLHKKWHNVFLFLITIACFLPVATADGFVVVTNKDSKVSSLSKAQLKKIYLGQKLYWENKERILPVRLDDNAPTTKSFLVDICQKRS